MVGLPAEIKWLLPEKLAKSSAPDGTDLLQWKAEEISSIVNLLEMPFKSIADAERSTGFRVLHSPVDDFDAPGIVQLNEIVDWINKEINSGGKVAVHCYAGIGRTGTVLTAYLLSLGMDLSTAAEKVLMVGAAPQSQEQEKIIEEYYRQISRLQRD